MPMSVWVRLQLAGGQVVTDRKLPREELLSCSQAGRVAEGKGETGRKAW